MTDLISRLFSHWQTIHDCHRSRLDQKRQKALQDRLKDGYTEEDIRDAIEGCALSDWHMGQNERRQKYNDLTLICRDASHLDRFIEIKEQAKREAKRAEEKFVARADPEVAREAVIQLRNRMRVG